MENLSWKDSEVGGLSIISTTLKPIFKELLPCNSGKSYNYHFWEYLKYYINIDKKETLVEEQERFKKYLLTKYNKQYV